MDDIDKREAPMIDVNMKALEMKGVALTYSRHVLVYELFQLFKHSKTERKEMEDARV